MSWAVLWIVAGLLGLALFALLARRRELSGMRSGVERLAEAKETGSHKARLQHPHIDLSRCIGCGLCVRACPEEDVLGLLHGQAVVVHGARCVGHGRCAEACPVGAIALTLGDVSERRDLPALSERFEALGQPGLFLAGELTGYALIRTAIVHGTAVADEVAKRLDGRARRPARALPRDALEPVELLIVGAGPAGIACSLRATELGLEHRVLESEEIGGTVAKYPRRKLVMTQPVRLPLVGLLDRTSFEKEELVELWARVIAEHRLPIFTGQEFQGLRRDPDGLFTVRTAAGEWRARNVCLALGRRGTPRKLGVPGEELPKVAYSLLDAQSYQGRRIVVVGGGDSAVEAAIGLAEQPGNRVLLSYRKRAFARIKARNERRLTQELEKGALEVLLDSELCEIRPDSVRIRARDEAGRSSELELANDEVFVFAGGVPPFELLERSGVSFDPAQRPAAKPPLEQGTGLVRALLIALGLALFALGFTVALSSYYGLELPQRPASRLHRWLRPSGTVGLAFGIAAALAMAANLLYLLRRSELFGFKQGALGSWMIAHVATGVSALLVAILHSAMAPRDTVGGHALAGLAVLVATGAIGRYLYAFVPRAANGRELALDEVRLELAGLAAEWDRDARGFGGEVRAEVQGLIEAGHWSRSFFKRLTGLVGHQRRVRAALARLRARGRSEGVPEDELARLVELARRASRSALAAARYEDLRALLGTWRWLHRWVALLVVLLVVLHVVTALRFAELGGGGP